MALGSGYEFFVTESAQKTPSHLVIKNKQQYFENIMVNSAQDNHVAPSESHISQFKFNTTQHKNASNSLKRCLSIISEQKRNP